MRAITVVDYGIVNLANIVRGLARAGGEVSVSNHPEEILKAERVVLPGVGAFAAGMTELSAQYLDKAIIEVALAGTPVLGICLGMQMLLDNSEENGLHKGLGLISGSVKAIPKEENREVRRRKVPHIGWNSLRYPLLGRSWQDTCLASTKCGEFCYFAHSFMTVPEDQDCILARCDYEGLSIAAAIHQENITGLQFHPERSGPVGLGILEHFVNA